MFLLTWHGTLLCLPGEGAGLTHMPIAGAVPLSLDLAAAEQSVRTSLGMLQVQPAAGGRGLWISRFGQFLCADADTGAAAFDRARASLWETFLPVSAQHVAVLRHILGHGWIDTADRRLITRRAVRMAPGFRLMLGEAALDVTSDLPSDDASEGLPDSIDVFEGDMRRRLVRAFLRGSALLRTQPWPVRVLRDAETVALALRRHLDGSEPEQAVFDADVAGLVAEGGVAGLPLYLERCFPAARAPAPQAGPVDAADAGADALFADGVAAQLAGDYLAAAAAWTACLAADPAHKQVRARLAELMTAMGRPLAALRLLEQAAGAAGSGLEQTIILAGRYSELGWWDRAQAVVPASDDALTGWLLQTVRNVRRVFAAHTETVARLSAAGNAASSADRLLLCQTRLLTGELDAAEAGAEALLRERPGQFPPHRVRAEAWVRRAGAPAGIAYLRALDMAFGNNPAHRLLLGRLLVDNADYGAAGQVLRPLLDSPHRSAAHRLLALAAFCRADSAAFAELSREWLDASPRETQAARFVVAAARAAGTLPRFVPDAGAHAPAGLRIVQFWHAPEPPADVAAAMASWPARNPGLEHDVFDADRARVFIADNHGGVLLNAYDRARHPAMQSDLFRLAYLSVHGGVYADADELCVADMRGVFAALQQVQLVAWTSHDTFPYLHNNFLAAIPGCAVLRGALEEAVRVLDASRAAGTRTDIWDATGPGLLTRAVGRRLAKSRDVLLLTDAEYRSFAHTLEDLEYKGRPEGNWRLS